MKNIFGILLGSTLLTSLSFASCNNPSTSNTAINVETSADSANMKQAVYNFAVKDENQNEIHLADLKGKVVFINFWATWCPPCIQEMPSIAALKKRFPNHPDLVFLMVDVDNNIEKSSKFMLKNKLDLKAHTPSTAIPSDFLGNSIPTTVVLDKDGEIAIRVEGGRNYDTKDVIDAISDLLK